MKPRALAAVLLLATLGVGCHRPDAAPAARADRPPAISPEPKSRPEGSTASEPAASSLHQLSARRLDGTPEALSVYRGKVLLVVNTASECGYTPQYEGLEALYQRRRTAGFVVLGFPSNDFGGQEPGSSGEIAAFCKKNYGVSFPMFEKLVTKGPAASAIYELLARKHGPPAWNFHKYLVGKDGAVRAAFPSAVGPEDAQLAVAIDKALAE